MTTHATHISVAHGDGAVVTVRPTDDGRWFQMLHWYIASGAAARLYRAHKAAPLLVQTLCHLRDRSSGLAVAPLEALRPLLGVKDSTIYQAKAAILRSPDGLATETTPQGWVFQLFPGRPFAGRVPDSENADPIPGTRNGFLERGISPSHSPSAQKDQTERQQQQQPQELRAQERPEPDAAAAAAEAAERAGIKQAEAADMIVVYGGVRVFNAITEAKARKGAPIRDPARWVRGALVQGWEIPDHWAMETARREREARLRGEAAWRLRAMAPDWHADDRAVILAAFGTADRLAAWLDTEPFGMAWRSYGADRLGRKVADAVRGGVVGQEVRA